MPHAEVSKIQRGRAKRLRRLMTRAEALLWRYLKAHRLSNLGFRRQSPIGAYIVDFVSRDRRLVVEIDGETHDFQSRLKADARRDAWLASRGYRVLRFTNDEVLKNAEGVALAIEQAVLSAGDPPPCPSPARGEGTLKQRQ